jgi:hypothetical protein
MSNLFSGSQKFTRFVIASTDLAKYLNEILKPFAQAKEHLLKNTFNFVNKVSHINTETDRYRSSWYRLI